MAEDVEREEVRAAVLQDDVAVAPLEVHHLHLVRAAVHEVQAVFWAATGKQTARVTHAHPTQHGISLCRRPQANRQRG